MTQEQAKQRTKKEYRSIAEFKKHFFPNAYKEEEERSRDPQTSGTGLVKDLMEGIRRELRK